MRSGRSWGHFSRMIVGSWGNGTYAFGQFLARNGVRGTRRRGESRILCSGITMPGGDIDRGSFGEVCTS